LKLRHYRHGGNNEGEASRVKRWPAQVPQARVALAECRLWPMAWTLRAASVPPTGAAQFPPGKAAGNIRSIASAPSCVSADAEASCASADASAQLAEVVSQSPNMFASAVINGRNHSAHRRSVRNAV
jgi:hypothetical protein